MADLNRMLDAGVKIAVPRDGGDSCARSWAELAPGLSRPEQTETPGFVVYRRGLRAQK